MKLFTITTTRTGVRSLIKILFLLAISLMNPQDKWTKTDLDQAVSQYICTCMHVYVCMCVYDCACAYKYCQAMQH